MKSSKQNRRSFIANSTKASLAIGLGSTFIGGTAASAVTNSHQESYSHLFATGFDQKPLPYDYKALEPAIDAMTMEIHYTKHAATYAKNLNEAAQAEKIDRSKPLEDIFGKISRLSEKLRNNAGGHFNHELFWQSMRAPKDNNQPSGSLLAAINGKFTSFDNFKKVFSDAGKNRFGSGWAWLILKDRQLLVTSTPNQDNPLMDVAGTTGFPVLGLDVWEHAYYLKYQNKRPDYIDNWWSVVNWDFIQQRYDSAMK
jgi:Fe-Mn family superoxide dismutase